MNREGPQSTNEPIQEAPKRPEAEVFAKVMARIRESAENKAQRSIYNGSKKTLEEETNFWLENAVRNVRRLAEFEGELTPSVGFVPDMYPGFTKEDLATLADKIEDELPKKEPPSPN